MPGFALSEQIINKMRKAESELGIEYHEHLLSPQEIGIWQGKYHMCHPTDTLQNHIATYGIMKPLIVVKNIPRFTDNVASGQRELPYLVIDGSKRLHVCQQLNLKVPVVIKEFSVNDAMALIAYDLTSRKQSEYVLAMQLHLWLKQKRLSPQALVELTDITLRRLNRLLSFAQLPQALTTEIGCMRHVSVRTANVLVKILQEDPSMLTQLIDIAEQIATGASEARIKSLLESNSGCQLKEKYERRLRQGNTVLMECRANVIKLNKRLSEYEDYASLVDSLEKVVKDWEENHHK